MTTQQPVEGNPYVGPRTFEQYQNHLFFGREQEARDLLSRVISERLVLFYAQSGAGKSSLINARLIPALQAEGFSILPIGRVSGELPAAVNRVDNIFLFNLMLSLDQSDGDPLRFASLPFTDFLARLASDDGEQWAYDPRVAQIMPTVGSDVRSQPFVLVIDQFEEIVTSHPDRWKDREEFFRQLNQALADDPNLWMVLTLREDYVAALDPYAPLLGNRLRPRFYMERMDITSAREAVRNPAELAKRPFADGVAERLVDDLRQVRVPGQKETIPGQYVEPVQLQVVCYQLWDNLADGSGGSQITYDDLNQAGDVNKALTQFYEESLLMVLADSASQSVSEHRLRSWFDNELITEAGTRGLVHRGKESTGGVPNAVVKILQDRFLVRTEIRAGGTWVELVHDRFVDPIRENNETWFMKRFSVLQQQALLWEREGRPEGLLLRGEALNEAERWAEAQKDGLESYEDAFLNASLHAAQNELLREKKRTRLITLLALVAAVVAVLALLAFSNAQIQRVNAERLADDAEAAENEALRQQSAALAAGTVASGALATTESNLLLALETARASASQPEQTEQAVQTELAPTEPAHAATESSGEIPTPEAPTVGTKESAETSTPISESLVDTYQKQLLGIQATKTRLASLARGRIAFVSDENGADSIFVMDVDDPSGAQQITQPDDTGYDWWPAWCGDDEIVFERADNSGQQAWQEIVSVNVGTGEEEEITSSSMPEGSKYNGVPSCSPDGRYLAVSSLIENSETGRPAWLAVLIDTVDRSFSTLGDNPYKAGHTTWSRDGSSIAFMHFPLPGDSSFHIYSLNLDDPSETVIMTRGSGYNSKYPSWAPASDKIAYACGRGSDDNRTWSLCTSRAGEEGVSVLLADIGYGGETTIRSDNRPGHFITPSWSPDGHYLTFAANESGNWEIYTLELASGELLNLTNTPGIDEMHPVWGS